MTNTRLLWLPLDPAQAATCLHLDAAGNIISRGQATPATPFAASDAPCRLVIPGMEARALWLSLAARSHAQAVAAARALATPHLAGAGEDLHVAVAPSASIDALRLVVLIERTRLQTWIDRARALGIEPTSVTPDHLMLPAGDGDAAIVLDFGSHWAARAGTLAFAAEPALAQQVLGTRPVRRVAAEDDIEALPGSSAPAIDLLGDGPVQGEARLPKRRARRLAWLAAALALSPALLIGAQALRHVVAGQLLQQHAQARIAEALQLDTQVANPAGHTARALAILQAPERFAGTAGALFDAMAQLDGAHLVALRYRDGLIEADVAHPDPRDRELLLTALAGAGIDARMIDSRAATGGMRSRLQLEVRP